MRSGFFCHNLWFANFPLGCVLVVRSFVRFSREAPVVQSASVKLYMTSAFTSGGIVVAYDDMLAAACSDFRSTTAVSDDADPATTSDSGSTDPLVHLVANICGMSSVAWRLPLSRPLPSHPQQMKVALSIGASAAWS